MKSLHLTGLLALIIAFSILGAGCQCCKVKPAGTSSKAAPESKSSTQPQPPPPSSATASPASGASDPQGQPLFDGASLKGWKITEFGGTGDIEIKDQSIILHMGAILTGITFTNVSALPKTNYEIALEAMKIDGSDFFCALTFPVGESHCSFVVGGWGGGVVGISSIDGMDASENETTKYMNFDKGKWHRIRVRVTPGKLNAWINDEQLVDQSIEGRRISMRPGEIELSQPLGIATFQTSAAVRNIRLRKL